MYHPSDPKCLSRTMETKYFHFLTTHMKALTELSGGQKSLVSIALVLAQVSYNPYSVYIFDEVITTLSSSLRSMLLLMKRIQHEL